MNEGKISVRYAKALFLIGKRERSRLMRLREDMDFIFLSCHLLSDVRDLLVSPVIENTVKKNALSAAY